MRLPNTSLASALTPENVPTPPAAAQAPELSPFDTEMPLPPSTSGNTSRPEMMSGFKAITLRFLHPRRLDAQRPLRRARLVRPYVRSLSSICEAPQHAVGTVG